MPSVNVNTKKATVIDVHSFQTRQGYGVDFYVEANSGIGTVYLQIVLYDDRARKATANIQKGDLLDISGCLKHKTYQKKDGSTGSSLVIENPTLLLWYPNTADTASQELQSDTMQQCICEDTVHQSISIAEADQQYPQTGTAQRQTAEENKQIMQSEPKRYPPLQYPLNYRRPTADDVFDMPF